MGLSNKFGEKYGGANFFPKKLIISGQSTCRSYGGLKYLHDGGLKNYQERIWGREIVFGENMGARNIFWDKYGGAKHFLEKLWGCEFFSCFLKTHPTGYPELKKTNPLLDLPPYHVWLNIQN